MRLDIPTLTTERLILRGAVPDDFEVFATFFATDRAQFVGGPADRRKAWRAFCHFIGHWVLRGYGSYVVTLKGSDAAVGLVGPWFPEGWPEQEIGWTMMDPAVEGKGVAQEAARATLAHAFGPLGWKTAVSYINPANERSVALARLLGAVQDTGAANPDDDDTLVFRHSAPEGL